MGDVKPWFMRGKTHVLLPCVFSTFLVSSNLFQPLYCLVLGSWGSYCFGEWGGRTVSPLPTYPLHPRLPILLPHALFPGQFTLTTIFGWLAPHAQNWGAILVSRRHFLPLHELLNAQALAIRVLLTGVHSHAENFPPVPHFHAQEFPGFYPRRFSSAD